MPSTSGWTRWAPLGGIIFGVLFVAGFFVRGVTPDYEDIAEWEAFYTDSGNRMQHIISGYMMVVAALALLWFITGLVSRLRSDSAELGGLRLGVLTSGIVFVTVLLAGAVALTSVAGSVSFGGAEAPGADLAIQFEQLGFATILLPGMLAGALFVALSGVAGRGSGLFPSWLTWMSVVVAVLLLLSPLFLPSMLMFIWAIVTGVVLLRRAM
jgi:hypothetical protein